jgi:signal transduction histidine kinase
MQVISNLFTNAIKFTRGGKVAIIIDNSKGTKARKERRERGVTVSFRDNGTGIDPEIMDKIFEKLLQNLTTAPGLAYYL